MANGNSASDAGEVLRFSLCSKWKEKTFETQAQKSALSSLVLLQISTGPKHHPSSP
jgi:hypothetical protein